MLKSLHPLDIPSYKPTLILINNFFTKFQYRLEMEGIKSSSDNIDYTEKIRNFQAMVDNYNEEIALSFLTLADWDETVNI